jgi:Ser/Thr protein kinase RdoA (MazF antagonist)
MSSIHSSDFSEILHGFDLEQADFQIAPYGSGHINHTYLLKSDQLQHPDYLLQKINNYVFKDVDGLMNNVARVIRHLKDKLRKDPGADENKEVLTLLPARDGKQYYQDSKGEYWRIYHYLDDTKSYDLVTSTTQAFEGGKAFGRFQLLLADLDAALLIETIPNFHHIEKRLQTFEQSCIQDAVSRKKDCQPEIDFIRERAERMCIILEKGRKGLIPLRITHNDTKFNNVLLDPQDNAQCVIDLDTVMPGYVAYDFGDAVRTIINTCVEDEPDLSKISLNTSLFKAYTEGYLQEAIDFLTDEEIESLIEGAFLLPYMQAVRFLTDFLDGDKYFKIHSPLHNLQRTRAQLQLLSKLEEQEHTLRKIIKDVTHNLKTETES